MPKLKSKRGAAKRFRQTKSGKVKLTSCARGHLLRHKSQKQKRRLRKIKYAHTAMEKTVKVLLPYGAPK
ncbi:MAG: 50S ribosomal protein L35 [Myxococcota bacterium]